MRALGLVVATLAMIAVNGLGAQATPTAEPPTAEPMWTCNTQDIAVYKKVNDCRRGCAEERDRQRETTGKECRATGMSCRKACGDDAACKQACADTADQCLKSIEAINQKCADACVTSNGCTL